MRPIVFSSMAILIGLYVSACKITTPVSSNLRSSVVTSYASECGSAQTSTNLTAYMYLRYGFSEIKGLCRGFFDGITEENRKARFSRRAIDAGQLAALTAMNATFASAKAISLVSAGIVLADSLIQDFVEIYAFSPYASQIEVLTKQAMDDYERVALTGSTGWQADPTRNRDNFCLADIYVKDFASLCSISAIQAKMDGLANKPATVVQKDVAVVIQGVAASPNAVIYSSPVPGAPSSSTPIPSTNYVVR